MNESYTSFRIFVHELEFKEMFARGVLLGQRRGNKPLNDAIHRAYRCALYSAEIPPAEIIFEPGELKMRFDDELNH